MTAMITATVTRIMGISVSKRVAMLPVAAPASVAAAAFFCDNRGM